MKRYCAIMMLFSGLAIADYPDVEPDSSQYVGPHPKDVELISVEETSPYGSDRPLSITIRNHSELYLDRVSIKCTITDARGHRAFKKVVFKSNPILSPRIAFPPISTPELGIPPGARAEVGLYTDDNRWFRGHGDYRYDCQIYGVSGRE